MVHIPLKSILIILLMGIAGAAWLAALGPLKWSNAWFESRAIIMKAEATKQAVDIVGADNYFRGLNCGDTRGH